MSGMYVPYFANDHVRQSDKTSRSLTASWTTRPGVLCTDAKLEADDLVLSPVGRHVMTYRLVAGFKCSTPSCTQEALSYPS